MVRGVGLNGKEGKDRITVLPQGLHDALRNQISQVAALAVKSPVDLLLAASGSFA